MIGQLNRALQDTLSLNDLGIVDSVCKCVAPRLEELRGKKIIFSSDDKKVIPIDGWGLKSNPHNLNTVIPIRPIKENILVAAIDSSSLKLAETEEGRLYGVKCGVVISCAGRTLMHFKIGPLLFYLSESTIQDSELEERLARLVLLDDDFAKRLLRVRAERAVQRDLARHLVNSLILVDGSLKISVFEDRLRSLSKIAESCIFNKNMMIGISKGTKLKVLDRAASPLTKVPGPAYIEIDMIVKSLVKNILGYNSMIKLENSAPIIRADILGDRSKSLGLLLGNDSVAGGYPESLRLSHHISNFTTTEITCLRSHVLNSYDVTELAADDIRSLLLRSLSV